MSNTIDDGRPAFPAPSGWDSQGNWCQNYTNSEGMTLRQYAAIKLRVPDSGVEWLDKMIETSLRNDFAAKALQGLLAAPDVHGDFDVFAENAYGFADAVLRARDGGAA